jgi:iron uptake system component EfeO
MPHPRRRRSALALGTAGSAALMALAACSSSSTSPAAAPAGSQAAGSAPAAGTESAAGTASAASAVSAVTVTLKSDGGGDSCTPSATTAKAGPVTFTVQNQSATGIIEFELLQQERIVGEKENLAPGLPPVAFTVTLGGGSYQLYCPGAAKELTDFTVSGKSAPASTGSAAALLADGTKGYTSYVSARLADLLSGAKSLQAAVDAGNMKQAQAAYASTRQFYEKVESDVDGFIKPGFKPTDNAGNLDYLIDMRASNLDPKVGWHGFHAVERDLWQGGKITDSTRKLAAELVVNVTALTTLAPTITDKPEDLANGAASLLEEVQTNKVSGEEESYSHIDLSDLAANVEGARQAFAYLQPGLNKMDPALTASILGQFTSVDHVLGKYRDGTDLGGYDRYTPAFKKAHAKEISQAVQALQDPLSHLAQKVAAA